MTLQINELTAGEELALVGVLKAVIQADKDLSKAENEELKRVAKLMGARFHERVAEAKKRFFTLSDIKKHAETVERPEARQLIFNHAVAMAKHDGLIPEEADVLTWLAEHWGIEFFRK
jgi:hypothetical protein